MVSHYIAPFWKDFADIKVSQSLRPGHHHTLTPPQLPDALPCEFCGVFNTSKTKPSQIWGTKSPEERWKPRSGVTLQAWSPAHVCWRTQPTFWHGNVCKIWLTFVSLTDRTGCERFQTWNNTDYSSKEDFGTPKRCESTKTEINRVALGSKANKKKCQSKWIKAYHS